MVKPEERAGKDTYKYQSPSMAPATASAWFRRFQNHQHGTSDEIISEVSNYPNPGGYPQRRASKAVPLYLHLAADSDVDIRCMTSWVTASSAGTSAALPSADDRGPNTVPPNGWMELTKQPKSFEGRLPRSIKVSGSSGSTTVTAKIGVIH